MDAETIPLNAALSMMIGLFLFGVSLGTALAAMAWRDQHRDDQDRIKELGWLVTAFCIAARHRDEGQR